MSYGDGAQKATAPAWRWCSTLTSDDLLACAARADLWHRDGAATPLLLTRDEFVRSLDAFPIEYGEILDTHRVLFGVDPFTGLTINPEDVRRACEVQVKSHLLHLRENYIECGARPSEVGSPGRRFGAGVCKPCFVGWRASTTVRRARAAEIGAYAAARPGLDPRVVGDVLALVGIGDSAPVSTPRGSFPSIWPRSSSSRGSSIAGTPD